MCEVSGFNGDVFYYYLEKLKNSHISPDFSTPLVHCIMNIVAANDCANALLAVGAKPVMASAPEESGEITSRAQALVLNMGTFSGDSELAMLRSGKAANKLNIPIVLDPVGLHASSMRRESLVKMAKELRFSVIKGNLGEIEAMAKLPLDDRQEVGFTSEKENSGSIYPALAAKYTAEKYRCVCLLTGEADYISDGNAVWKLENGSPLLTYVTGSGCMTGALIGAFSTVSDSLTATFCGSALMNISGQTAAENYTGTASYRIRLMDLFSQLSVEIPKEKINEMLKISQINFEKD